MKNFRTRYFLPLLGALATTAADAASSPSWQIEIEGLPALGGANVMPLNIGNIRKSNLIGANAIVNFSVTGEDPLQIMGAQVYFLDSGTRCDRGHGSPGTGELQVEQQEDRVVVSGRISCVLKDGEAEMRAISGWYEP